MPLHRNTAADRSLPIRDAATPDYAAILALNAQSVDVLSPLNDDRLAQLHQQAAALWVAEEGDDVVGFLIAVREGANYDSPNYQWFAEQLPSFLYLDRIVIGAGARGRGLGVALYERLFDLARSQEVTTVACEIDIEPPNAGSARFHSRLGFAEVGRQSVQNGKKVVSLQTVGVARE